MAVEYVSYSAWKDWKFCPYRHKIIRIDKVRPFEGSIYSCFGTAVHDTAEASLMLEREKEILGGEKEEFEPKVFFNKRFKEELDSLDKSKLTQKDLELLTEQNILEFKKQGEEIVPLILPEMKKYFGDFKVVEAEQEIRQTIDGFPNFDFYGFIDLIIQTSDGKYHIIDWKTCSWGWEQEKRNSTETTYQLTFYKHFFCKATGAKPEDVETHFGLLKRTAKENKVELFRVTSGNKKISNALNVLNNCVTNISRSMESGKFVKNKLNCTKCEFYKTIHCP